MPRVSMHRYSTSFGEDAEFLTYFYDIPPDPFNIDPVCLYSLGANSVNFATTSSSEKPASAMSKGPRPGEMLNKKQASRLRQILITSVGLLLLYVFLVTPEASLDSSKTILDTFPDGPGRRPRHPKALLDNRFLTAEQCAAAFPGLTKEIDDAVAKGPFVLERTSELGPLIARIKDGKVCRYSHV